MRIGVLGAAGIAPEALLEPARENPDVDIAAIAARDLSRAHEFAAKHRVREVHASYEELLADPSIDAVYNPTPNGLHGRWTLAALAAGKHVLCEKPFTANATEARLVADAADAAGLVVMEAFHYRYHPFMRRMEELLASGELGEVQHVETAVCFPLPRFKDIRYNLALAGGATMDAGCYAVHMARLLGGSTPTVVSAQAKLKSPDVDRAMTASLKFASGATGRIRCSLWSSDVLRITARVQCSNGELRAINPLSPRYWHRLSIRRGASRSVERFTHRPSYAYQLEAFADAVLRDAPVSTSATDAIETMTVIDAIYEAAGLRPRVPTS
ncbi:Gfo/Idh/MocA family oxidoreductase [Amycolatopsis rhabdoformis]|uniref:Gfo/Idh/MocA family oxidoreductase n=1 Tax=Amycolatopsis rhabdoformis TaxID=1448059 RepID=A0ABZ1I6Q0_9PSEU|nr:Gfo/Idh/MocA family oxidoreductase [Amycolatopsis rhabdoformis]WSE30012.1 Gfo/Idh/MocA family oxidoreductase [Amycolatopsis rhabdoformis]